MTQKLLERYVLPYLPPKDVEARRERAREVRDNAAARASEASQVPSGGDSGRNMNIAAAAAAAAAMALAGGPALGDNARAGLSSSNAALQQMIQLHTQRAMRAVQGRQRDVQSSGQPQGDMSVHEALTQSLHSAQEVLRNLQERRRRRHQGGSNGNANARTEGITWTAMSTNVDHSTPCHHCRANIPPRILRMRRVLSTGVQEYYHANYDCLRSVHNEICDLSSIRGLDTISEQGRRILTAIASVVPHYDESDVGSQSNPIDLTDDTDERLDNL